MTKLVHPTQQYHTVGSAAPVSSQPCNRKISVALLQQCTALVANCRQAQSQASWVVQWLGNRNKVQGLFAAEGLLLK